MAGVMVWVCFCVSKILELYAYVGKYKVYAGDDLVILGMMSLSKKWEIFAGYR